MCVHVAAGQPALTPMSLGTPSSAQPPNVRGFARSLEAARYAVKSGLSLFVQLRKKPGNFTSLLNASCVGGVQECRVSCEPAL